MHYMVTFQHSKRYPDSASQAKSAAHFEADASGMIPDVGDVVRIDETGGAKVYQGVVASRVFYYSGAGQCEITILLEENPRSTNGYGH